jgi:hypothetical protein
MPLHNGNASGRFNMWLGTEQVAILSQNVNASPDHLNVIAYVSGDRFLIGSSLMPAGLATQLQAAGLITIQTGVPSNTARALHQVQWASVAYAGQVYSPSWGIF